jgi:16S rRNA (guanine527-N7)-methyltransferase
VLLDAHGRRCEFARRAVDELGLTDRIQVIQSRAEDAARDPNLRGRFALVTARGFGPPPVTAECAVGFLVPGGRLAVSEPPDPEPRRWPEEGLRSIGFGPAELRRTGPVGVAVTVAWAAPDERWPRVAGRPAKRPVW